MRILQVVPTYFPALRYGGPIYSVRGLAGGLAENHEVHVYTTNVDGNGNSAVPLKQPVMLDGAAVTYFPCRFGRRLFYSPAMHAALAANIASFDIVHIHAMFLWPGLAAARLAQKRGIPYVMSPRGMLVRGLIARRGALRKRAWLALFDRKSLAQAQCIHATSQEEEASIRALGFDLAPIAVIPNGVDPPQPQTGPLSDDVKACIGKGFDVLALGRINWEKGLDSLIAALPHAPGLTAIIAGNDEAGHAASLRRLAEEKGVSDRVCFLPRHISGTDKEALLAQAKIAVLLSPSENFGNVVLEAMIRGLPVVAGTGVGAGAAVKASGGGLVTSTAPQPLAEALMRLAVDAPLRQRSGAAARRYAGRHFTWPVIAGEMAKLYETARQRHAELGSRRK